MKKRYFAIAAIGFLILFFALFQMGLTVVLNQTGSQISVAVTDNNRRAGLVSFFGSIFVGFPQIEGSYEVTCLAGGDSENMGYVTKRGFNRMVIRANDVSC